MPSRPGGLFSPAPMPLEYALSLLTRQNRRGSIGSLAIGIALLLLAAGPRPLAAQWRLEGWFGNAFSLNSGLTFKQDGQPDIHVDADWSTRPWRPTWYYSMRIAKWSGNSAWAFEYMHHKLYLDNPPTPEVTRFRITNGVNNLLAERHWRVHGWELGVGAGPMLAVPVSTVRGKDYGRAEGVFGSRYVLSGATMLGTVAHRLKLLPYTYGSLALKATVTPMSVPIAEGHATTTNLAVHLQYGLSFQSKP